MKQIPTKKIPAEAFVEVLRANVDYMDLSNAGFRIFVRSVLKAVETPDETRARLARLAKPRRTTKSSGYMPGVKSYLR